MDEGNTDACLKKLESEGAAFKCSFCVVPVLKSASLACNTTSE